MLRDNDTVHHLRLGGVTTGQDCWACLEGRFLSTACDYMRSRNGVRLGLVFWVKARIWARSGVRVRVRG